MKINEPEQLGAETAKQLIEAKPEDLPVPPLKLGNDLASRIVKYMQLKKYEIFQGIRQYNIVYVEGMNGDATLNNDPPNNFNDRRMVIQIVDGVPAIVGNWQGTTEPGYRYTQRPMNPGGAARIKFGQYKAWQVGIHGTTDRHEALIQTGERLPYTGTSTKTTSALATRKIRATLPLISTGVTTSRPTTFTMPVRVV
jgi:hypothetical protein